MISMTTLVKIMDSPMYMIALYFFQCWTCTNVQYVRFLLFFPLYVTTHTPKLVDLGKFNNKERIHKVNFYRWTRRTQNEHGQWSHVWVLLQSGKLWLRGIDIGLFCEQNYNVYVLFILFEVANLRSYSIFLYCALSCSECIGSSSLVTQTA